MPCGGIIPLENRRRIDGPCWFCNQPGPDCWLEEWDAFIHSECVEDFLVTEEGAIVLDHGHGVAIWDDDNYEKQNRIEVIWYEVLAEDKKMFTEGTGYNIDSDGQTVWVNQPFGNIARFSARGIDIHEPPSRELTDKGVCLFCKPGMLKKEDWQLFKDKMFEHYNIVIGDEHTPLRYR